MDIFGEFVVHNVYNEITSKPLEKIPHPPYSFLQSRKISYRNTQRISKPRKSEEHPPQSLFSPWKTMSPYGECALEKHFNAIEKAIQTRKDELVFAENHSSPDEYPIDNPCDVVGHQTDENLVELCPISQERHSFTLMIPQANLNTMDANLNTMDSLECDSTVDMIERMNDIGLSNEPATSIDKIQNVDQFEPEDPNQTIENPNETPEDPNQTIENPNQTPEEPNQTIENPNQTLEDRNVTHIRAVQESVSVYSIPKKKSHKSNRPPTKTISKTKAKAKAKNEKNPTKSSSTKPKLNQPGGLSIEGYSVCTKQIGSAKEKEAKKSIAYYQQDPLGEKSIQDKMYLKCSALEGPPIFKPMTPIPTPSRLKKSSTQHKKKKKKKQMDTERESMQLCETKDGEFTNEDSTPFKSSNEFMSKSQNISNLDASTAFCSSRPSSPTHRLGSQPHTVSTTPVSHFLPEYLRGIGILNKTNTPLSSPLHLPLDTKVTKPIEPRPFSANAIFKDKPKTHISTSHSVTNRKEVGSANCRKSMSNNEKDIVFAHANQSLESLHNQHSAWSTDQPVDVSINERYHKRNETHIESFTVTKRYFLFILNNNNNL